MELPILRISFIFILLFFSAFFSGSETAIFSYGKLGLLELEKENIFLSKKLKYLLANPSKLLLTILLGNETVNVIISSMIASIVSEYYLNSDWKTTIILSIAITTPLILIFAEITPKAIAIKSPRQLSIIAIRPLFFFYKLIDPLTKLFQRKVNLKENGISETDFLNMVEASVYEQKLEDYEKKLIKNIFIFSDTKVEKIMTPKDKVFFIKESTDFETIVKGIRETEYSRIPVLDEYSNYVIGVLYSKKLLPYLEKYNKGELLDFDLNSLIVPLTAVPKKIKLFNLLKILKQIKQHLCVVVDEHGDMLGLVTMEDILEELFGEIKDERDINDES